MATNITDFLGVAHKHFIIEIMDILPHLMHDEVTKKQFKKLAIRNTYEKNVTADVTGCIIDER